MSAACEVIRGSTVGSPERILMIVPRLLPPDSLDIINLRVLCLSGGEQWNILLPTTVSYPNACVLPTKAPCLKVRILLEVSLSVKS